MLFRFYWKIVTDPERNLGVAVIGINNPHLEVCIIEVDNASKCELKREKVIVLLF